MVWTHSVSITLCRTWNGRAIGWKKVLFSVFMLSCSVCMSVNLSNGLVHDNGIAIKPPRVFFHILNYINFAEIRKIFS